MSGRHEKEKSVNVQVLLRCSRLVRKSCGAMHCKFLLAMSTIENWLCPKTLPRSISTGSSLSIRYFIEFGQMFGQRVWFIIQVSLSDSLEGLNLNITHNNVYKGPETIHINVQPAMGGELLQPYSLNIATLVKPVDELPKKDPDLNFPINATFLHTEKIQSAAPCDLFPSFGFSKIFLSEITIASCFKQRNGIVLGIWVWSSASDGIDGWTGWIS